MTTSGIDPREQRRVRLVVSAGLLSGAALMLLPVLVDGVGYLPWIFGVPLVLVFGYILVGGVIFRLRHPDAEERARLRERLLDTSPDRGDTLARRYLAGRAVRGKDRVLRSGTAGTALVTLVADGHQGNELQSLVYLELDVTVGDAAPYRVRTGEYLTAASAGSVAPGRSLAVRVDPTDPQRVAVDWDRSLRR